MRDPKRIYAFCNQLAALWATEVPDWRFGQLICNVLGTSKIDPFFLEENDMMKLFEKYFGKTTPTHVEIEDNEDLSDGALD